MGKEPDEITLDFINRVKKDFKIEKAILFGSRARGDNLKDSDYDIILVSPEFKDIFFSKRISNMYKYWRHFPLEVEPLCYTPEEFERKKKQLGIVKTAAEEGLAIA